MHAAGVDQPQQHLGVHRCIAFAIPGGILQQRDGVRHIGGASLTVHQHPRQNDLPGFTADLDGFFRQLAEKAVKVGSKSGEIVLARVLVNRQAGPTDVAHAITLLQDAARDSESDAAVDAQMLLGLIYASGVHGPEDDVKASEYFKGSSALSRTGYAEYWAGMMFQQGEKGFIEPNKQKALHWLNVSCLEGFDTGCEEFDRISKG